jgi:amidohydrolase
MLEKARNINEKMSTWRRDFHMHPELGFQETRTAAKIAEILQKFGYRVRRGVGRTGVIADIGSGKPMIAIRADMDALPLQETSQVAYASLSPGVMHACGHDSHIAMALGAADLLSREKFPGTVRFLFQPSEEVGDEQGISGAPHMISAGAMDGVEMVIALHVEATAPVGTVRIRSGPASGGVDSWFGEIIGTGGHGAHPHLTIDPFCICAHVILALNGIVSRRIDPFDPAVISIGSLHGGFTENVIPERVKLTGTLRYTEKHVQEQIHTEIRRAFEIARTLGGDYNLKFEIGNGPMINSPVASDLIAAVAVDLLGKEKILPWKDELGAEDFGSYLELVPGAMFALGSGSEHFQCHLHNPDFDLDETCLPVGAAIFAETALRFLQAKNPK